MKFVLEIKGENPQHIARILKAISEGINCLDDLNSKLPTIDLEKVTLKWKDIEYDMLDCLNP